MVRLLIAAAVLLASSAVTNADQHWRPTEAQQEIIDLRVADTLRLLGEIVQSTLDNYQCQAKTFRRLGLSPAGGELYYLVRCADSEQYTIRVRRDATGQLMAHRKACAQCSGRVKPSRRNTKTRNGVGRAGLGTAAATGCQRSSI